MINRKDQLEPLKLVLTDVSHTQKCEKMIKQATEVTSFFL